MSYSEERLHLRKHINEQNKRRARQMEQRIAKKLSGQRVPMSGAGSIKGDCRVNSPFGEIMIECKYSSKVDLRTGDPYIRFEFAWLEKLEKDVKSMKSAFGILVFHYHDVRFDYVVMRPRDFNTLFGWDLSTAAVLALPASKMGTPLAKPKLDKMMLDNLIGERVLRLYTGDEMYIVCMLDDFAAKLEEYEKTCM